MSDAKLTATVTCDASQAIAAFNNYQKAVGGAVDANKQAGGSFSALAQATQLLPGQFGNIASSLTPMIEGFQALKAEGATTGEAIKTLSSSLLSGGGLALIFGGVTAAVLPMISSFMTASSEIDKNTAAIKEATKAALDWKKAIDGITKGAADEATKVTEIVALLNAQTLSRKEQVAAVEQLTKINQEHFGGLNKEKSTLDQINAAYQDYATNIDKGTDAKALDLRIQDLYNKKLDITTSLQQYKQLSDRIKDVRHQIATTTDLPTLSRLSGELLRLNKESGLSFPGIDNLDEKLKEINFQINALVEQRAKLGNKGLIQVDKEKDIKPVDDLAERIKALQDLLKKGLLGIQGRDQLIDLSAQMIVRDKTKNHFTNDEVNKLIDNLELEINSKIQNKRPLNLKALGFEVPDKIDTEKALKGIKGGSVWTIPVDINLKLKASNAQKALDDLNLEIENSVKDLVGNLANNLGDAIGSVITGKGLKGAFESFGQSIGGFMKEVGQAFIKFSLQMIVIDKAIRSLKPELSLLAGVAMVALGSAIQQSIVKQTPFAKGGIVTGPTNALIGEAGPEVVFPLSQLNRFIRTNMNNAPQTVIVRGEISGQNILLANRRAQKNQNLYTRS